MGKTTLFLFLIATGTLFALGCDPGTKTAVGVSASGLVDETSADTVVDDLANLGDDPAPLPLEVAWTDGAETSEASVATLQFEVRNISDGAESGTVRLLCSSVLDRNAALDLGAFALDPGEVQTFSVAAADLPIRSSMVLTQAMVEISRTYTRPGDVAGTAVTVEAPRFYRHEDGFETVKPFTESQVSDDLGGVLFTAPSAFSSASVPGEAAAAEAVLGEVKNAEDGFDSVTMASEGIALRDEKGNVYAYLVGGSFGVADASDGVTDSSEGTEGEVADE
jgi:hypothetical protein